MSSSMTLFDAVDAKRPVCKISGCDRTCHNTGHTKRDGSILFRDVCWYHWAIKYGTCGQERSQEEDKSIIKDVT